MKHEDVRKLTKLTKQRINSYMKDLIGATLTEDLKEKILYDIIKMLESDEYWIYMPATEINSYISSDAIEELIKTFGDIDFIFYSDNKIECKEQLKRNFPFEHFKKEFNKSFKRIIEANKNNTNLKLDAKNIDWSTIHMKTDETKNLDYKTKYNIEDIIVKIPTNIFELKSTNKDFNIITEISKMIYDAYKGNDLGINWQKIDNETVAIVNNDELKLKVPKTIFEGAFDTFEKCKSLLTSKKHDYSKVTDEFSNFKFSADIAKVKPEQSMFILVGTKVARLSELIAGKTPKNEAVEDTIIDLINYLVILKTFLENKNGQQTTV
jgi:hypothetical protein